MRLDLNTFKNELFNNQIAQNFIKELGDALMKKNNLSQKLTDDELREYDRKSFEFLENFFAEKNLDNSKDETFIVHLKYDNDPDNRYKVAQYKDGFENLYVTHGENLPNDVQVGDVLIKKEDGHFYHDYESTKYVKENLESIRQNILNKK